MVRDEVVVAGELDGPFGPEPGRVHHAGPVRVVADQVAGHVEGGPGRVPGIEPGASVGEQGVQPVPFGVGPLGQPAQVDRHGLGAAHQRDQAGTAERRIRIALRRRALQVRDQPGVRGPRGRQGTVVGTAAGPGGEPGRQAAYGAEQGLRHRGAHLVQRGDGRVGHLRPDHQVLGPRGVPLCRRSVVPVVAGQVELAQVQQRVTAVQFEIGVEDSFLLLGRGQVRLVVRVRERLAAGARRGQPGEPGPYPGRRQVLRLAVVFVPAGEFS